MTPLCRQCGRAPRMGDWSLVPPEAVGQGWDEATGQPAYCWGCWATLYRDPLNLANTQTRDALDALAREAASFVRWPFASLDAVTGPMAPGTVHYVAGASGGGKSTFITSAIRGWVAAGVRTDVLPLEAEPWAWRTQMACVQADVVPGDVLSGELLIREQAGDAQSGALLDAVRGALRDFRRHTEAWRLLAVHPDRRVSAARLNHVMSVAAARGSQVVVVDHVDHVADDAEGGRGGGSSLDESRRVNDLLLDGAKEYGLIVIAMSQLNAARLSGHRDRLAKYGVPQTRDLYLHTFKEQNATSVLGLFRPLAPGLDPDVLARARAGEVEPAEVLAPGTMGVAMLKLRHYGGREGKRVYLAVERGAARERTPDEAREWEAATQGIRTGDDAHAGYRGGLSVIPGGVGRRAA